MRDLTNEELAAIKGFEQIDVLIEMYGAYLLQEPWTEVDRERLEKMEAAFYLLQDEFALKLGKLKEVFVGGDYVVKE